MQHKLLPYKMGSKSATDLARELGVKKLYRNPERSNFRPSRVGATTVVNWGCGEVPSHLTDSSLRWINRPASVSAASNKLATLQSLSSAGVPCLEYTTDQQQVRSWLAEGHTVFARTLLRAHSGRGIVVIAPDSPEASNIPPAPLYTKYLKKKHEYRVHVFHVAVDSYDTYSVQKRKRHGVEANWMIRNHANGFVFAQEMSFVPDDLTDVSIAALRTLGLDFAAFDVAYHAQTNRCYIIECNTSPALEGTTLTMYTTRLKEMLGLQPPV
jgi:glutathione synthase/RimK-type ligase-like ATP-grasp enzyme